MTKHCSSLFPYRPVNPANVYCVSNAVESNIKQFDNLFEYLDTIKSNIIV